MQTDLLTALAHCRPPFSEVVLTPYELPGHIPDSAVHKGVSVDLSRVKGIWHSDYCGATWASLLGDPARSVRPRLKRVDDCLRDLCDNPSYYLSREDKSGWSFYEVEGDLYLSSGHHRTVVGRFFLELQGLLPIVHGVTTYSLTPAHWKLSQLFPAGACYNVGAEEATPAVGKTGVRQ